MHPFAVLIIFVLVIVIILAIVFTSITNTERFDGYDIINNDGSNASNNEQNLMQQNENTLADQIVDQETIQMNNDSNVSIGDNLQLNNNDQNGSNGDDVEPNVDPRERPEIPYSVLSDVDKTQKIPQGWWDDVINCQNTGQINIYCKPKNQWIWPY